MKLRSSYFYFIVLTALHNRSFRAPEQRDLLQPYKVLSESHINLVIYIMAISHISRLEPQTASTKTKDNGKHAKF